MSVVKNFLQVISRKDLCLPPTSKHFLYVIETLYVSSLGQGNQGTLWGPLYKGKGSMKVCIFTKLPDSADTYITLCLYGYIVWIIMYDEWWQSHMISVLCHSELLLMSTLFVLLHWIPSNGQHNVWYPYWIALRNVLEILITPCHEVTLHEWNFACFI